MGAGVGLGMGVVMLSACAVFADGVLPWVTRGVGVGVLGGETEVFDVGESSRMGVECSISSSSWRTSRGKNCGPECCG